MSNRPCIFSFFAGSGFLDLGFENSGFNIVYVNEIFPAFLAAYRYSRQILNLPLPEYGYHYGEAADVSKLIAGKQAQRLGELIKDCRKSDNIVGFIGAPPCPDFSIGGKNKGYLGDNGKLSAAYVELICRNLPDFFLFENVKGLWRTKKHRLFFEALKQQLQEKGYILTERLINAIEYGVPQDRARIILIAIQSLPANFVLPEDMSLTNMFKTIGNGLPYLAAKALAQTILDFLTSDSQSTVEFTQANSV